ncbi:MAG: flagellar basal body-associated FliL family protein [Gammaproteobacteria bacterium]|nr:flagellar basal body-associated FliL family protein [Gammaproteobacteria bacterium]
MQVSKLLISSTTSVQYYAQILLLILLSVALISPLYAEEEEEEEVDDTQYYELSPPFVVNIQTTERRMRFLQVRLQVLGDPKAIEAVQIHNAPLRDVIITALSSQTRESVNTPKKKKTLQEKVQADVETVLKDLTGKKQIEGLYFTNFVIQ